VTDVDGFEAGEVELELNAESFRSLKGGAYVLQAGFEAEWLITSKLGLRVEPGVSRTVEAGAEAQDTLGGSATASWKLLHDFEHDFHLQAELGGRLPTNITTIVSPGDSALPYVLDLRTGFRGGLLTVRGSVGAAAGGTAAHLPLRASLALFTGFGVSEHFGFWGVELDADGTRKTPAVLALNVVPHLGPAGLPFRFGLAIPWAIGVRDSEPALGFLVRIFYESARELGYGRSAE
jgi:hypothetical protein